MGFFSQIRQRRLFQIVAAYLAAGWIGLQLMDQLTQQGILHELLYELYLIWYLAGIPAALLVGWHHGEKGKQNAPRFEPSQVNSGDRAPDEVLAEGTRNEPLGDAKADEFFQVLQGVSLATLFVVAPTARQGSGDSMEKTEEANADV